MDSVKVLGVVGSLRSCLSDNDYHQAVQLAESFDELTKFIYKRGGDQEISNSEALLLAGLHGLKQFGVEFDILNLKHLFPLYSDEGIAPETVMSRIENCGGIILSSPVYFGDRSSLIDDFIKELKKIQTKLKFPLRGKSVGIVSVGAKRNGGQETTNIFALKDCLDLGACIVGNGPPESQYGGTGWAGSLGGIIDDHFGLKTAKGTGNRVGFFSKINQSSQIKRKIKILILIAKNDMDKNFKKLLLDLPFSPNVDLDVFDISSLNIKRCMACKVCPNGNLDESYTCIITNKKDEMVSIHDRMLNSDGIILARYGGSNSGNDNFQIFMERNRFIRRNNYELTDRTFSFMTVTNLLDELSSMRAMVSFLRHNMVIVGPFYNGLQGQDDEIIKENVSLSEFSSSFETITKKVKNLRESSSNNLETQYHPIGYPEG